MATVRTDAIPSQGSVKQRVRRSLAALGLLPRVRRGMELLRAAPHWHKREFILEIDGLPVAFLTEDAHSKVWCHRRHRGRSEDMHEPTITEEFVKHARRSLVFADVGGHIGYYSCIAGVLNPRLDVHCFEMNALLAPAIRANFKRNGIVGVVIQRPVADRPKIVNYDGGSRSGGLSIRPYRQGDPSPSVTTITLDQHFNATGRMPDLIKIDVEGAEMDVLRGAEQVLRRRPVLFVEVHPHKLGQFGSSTAEVVEHLDRAGYVFLKTSYLRDRGALVPVSAAALARLEGTGDMVVCLPSSRP